MPKAKSHKVEEQEYMNIHDEQEGTNLEIND
jgi:hypothetical protein